MQLLILCSVFRGVGLPQRSQTRREREEFHHSIRTTIVALNVVQNQLPPVNWLPPEILTHIAGFVCAVSEDCTSQVSDLAQVCGYWRVVLTSYPPIWRDVKVRPTTPRTRVERVLERSGNLPLRVDIEIHQEDSGSHEHRSHRQDTAPNFHPSPHPFWSISLFEPHSSRIRCLRARYLHYGVDFDHGVGTFIRSLLFQDGFSALESLSLGYENARGNLSVILAKPLGGGLAGSFPRLEALTIGGLKHIIDPCIQCPNLKSLIIDHPVSQPRTPLVDSELDFLRRHHSLTSIVLNHQALVVPLRFSSLKSVVLNGQYVPETIANGMRPTFLRAMTSLTIQPAGFRELSFMAKDESGNSITCFCGYLSPLDPLGIWKAYRQFALDDVESVYFDPGSNDYYLHYRNFAGVFHELSRLANLFTANVLRQSGPLADFLRIHDEIRVERWVSGSEG